MGDTARYVVKTNAEAIELEWVPEDCITSADAFDSSIYDTAETPPREVCSDRMEPEDATWGRDLRPVVDELNRLAREVREPAPDAAFRPRAPTVAEVEAKSAPDQWWIHKFADGSLRFSELFVEDGRVVDGHAGMDVLDDYSEGDEWRPCTRDGGEQAWPEVAR